MKRYDFIIIGFGKAGKTFAKHASKLGKKVALVEKSPKMYGGTCINIACIPSKTLVEASRQGLNFEDAMNRKNSVVSALNNKNYHNLYDDENIDIFDGTASFISNYEIEVKSEDEIEILTSEKIIINTGANSVIPSISGIKESKFVHTSTSLLSLSKLPKKLVIIGAGYIGLEFASFFNRFGSEVTILNKSDSFLPREDKEISQLVKKDLLDLNINIIDNVDIKEIKDLDDEAIIITNNGQINADAILVATGRVANTKDLRLENTDIKLNAREEIVVNENLETDVEGIYAVGDVKGGVQFTYISLDDYRIIADHIFGNKYRNINNRKNIAYSVFITPILGRVGLTYEEAINKGYDAVENKVFVNQIPRHKINNDSRGLFKVVIDKKTSLILGASLYGENAEELINYIKMAMDNNIDYTYLRDNIYTHPTMIESFNDLFRI